MKQIRHVVCTLALLLGWTATSEAQATGSAKVIGPGETVTYQIVNGKALLQGDIYLGEHATIQKAGLRPLMVSTAVAGAANDPQRNAWSGNPTWLHGVVPYEFAPGLPMDARNAVTEAMRWISSQTRITFVQRSNHHDYLRIIYGTGCYSSVGRIGGMQDLSMGPGCGIPGTAAHELLHALGFWHEQSRADRDQHVIIHTQNIYPDQLHNFNKYGVSTLQFGRYDLDSIMHYGYMDFSRNGQMTITPVDPRISATRLGQRQRLSEGDIVALQQVYGAPVKPQASYAELRNGRDLCLTVGNGTQLLIATCGGAPGQRWLQDAEGRLTPQSHPGSCVSLSPQLTLSLLPCQNAFDQKWSVESSRFHNQAYPQMVLAQSSIGTAFTYYFVNNDTSQQWRWLR